MTEPTADKVYLHIRELLTLWVGTWFTAAEADEIVGTALWRLLNRALIRVPTAHGPYVELFSSIEFQMRLRSYSNGRIIPLGLHKAYPIPSYEDLEIFTGMYGVAAHMFVLAGIDWTERQDIGVFLILNSPISDPAFLNPVEEGEYKRGLYALERIHVAFHNHVEGTTFECTETMSFKTREWNKNQTWYDRLPTHRKEN